MNQQQTYCAFISYRHQDPDQKIAKALHTAIETYGIPSSIKKQTGKKKMGKVFRDQEELPLSADLGADIEAALDASEWFIAICSPRYLESKWCLRELEYFIQHKGRERVLTVLADDDPDKSFADMLRKVPNDDGTFTEVEPLAAAVGDPTMGGSLKKLKIEKLRILAPMLGVTFDDLRRRARKRKIRIAVTAGAIALAVAAGVGVFLGVTHARNEALRREAEEQARIAEEQARIAEEEQRRAEEEQRRAEEERRNAAFNDIGERMERASAALTAGEKREAAKILTDAIAVCDEFDGMRRNDVLALMRRTMYIEPLTVVASFNNKNMQLLFIEPSPDGTKAVGVVNNNSIAMVDLQQNEILYTVTADNAIMMYPHFSQDGTRFLADCDYGRFVQVWNTADGSEAFRYTSKKNVPYEIYNSCFWKDSDTLLVQDADQFLFVDPAGEERLFYTVGEQMEDYDPANNFLSKAFNQPLSALFTNVADGYAMQMLVSEDRERVVLTGKAGETAVIVLDGEGKRVFLPGIPTDPTCKMPGTLADKWSLSPDGKTLCCLSYYGFIAGWDMDTGDMIYIDATERENQWDMPTQPVFSPDSTRIAYTLGAMLYVVDARTNAPIMQANIDDTSFSPSLSFTSDGKYLLMTNKDAFIIDTETWALELYVSAEDSNFNGMIPMGEMVLCSRYDGIIYFYSLPSLASVATADIFSGTLMEQYEAQRAVACVPLTSQHELSPTFRQTNYYKDYPPQLFFSVDGSVAAMAHPDGTVELFDTQGDGTVQDTVGQLYTYINALGVTEDRLVAIDVDTRMMVYNMKTRSVEKIWNNGTQYSSFAFNGDGSLMMAMCAGLTRIDVYDLNDSCRLLFSMHALETFEEMAFSADGAYAVGRTAAGTYVVGDLFFADEDALIGRTRAFATGE